MQRRSAAHYLAARAVKLHNGKMRSRDELIELVREVMSTSACRIDMDCLLNELESSVPHLDLARLIFDPPNGKPMSPEEIVDQALSQTE